MSFNFMAAVTICSGFGTKKIKYVTVFTVSPSICHEVIGPYAMIIVFLSRSKCLNFVAAVTIHSNFGAQENKLCHYVNSMTASLGALVNPHIDQ